MSFQTFVTERLEALTAMMNAIATNAKKIDELPIETTLDPNSKIHVSKNGISKSLEVQKIIDSVSNNTYNQIIFIGEITNVDNVFTIASSQWKIDNLVYGTISDTVITVPYASSGKIRTDIFVATNLGTIVLVSGIENTGFSIKPNTPVDTVLISEININDNAILDTTNPIVGGDFIKKTSKRDNYITDSGAIENLAIEIGRKYIFTNATSFGGFANIPPFVRNADLILYDNEKFTLKNESGSNITLIHNSGSSDKPLFFYDGNDFVLKNEEIAEFIYANSRLECVGLFQPILVSGTNIKTVNGTSILGSGDLVVSQPRERIMKWWAGSDYFETQLSQQGAQINYLLVYFGTKQFPIAIGGINSISGNLLQKLIYRSSSTSGSSCGMTTGGDNVFPFSSALGYDVRILVNTSSLIPISTSRIAVGLNRLAGTSVGNINPSTMIDCVMVANDDIDGNLYIMHNDNSGTCTKIDLGVNFPHNTINCYYELFLKSNPNGTTIDWKINRYANLPASKTPAYSASGTISSNMPSTFSNPMLGWFAHRNNGSTSSSVEISVSYVENKIFY